jgi:GNAT superfamily N-acetyltransferase
MVQIRPSQLQDFDGVIALLRQLWPDKHLDLDLLRTVFQRALDCETQAYLCAVDGERVIGFGSLTLKNSLWQEGYLGHVDELVVDRDYRGHGIGVRLLTELTDLARRQGCRRVELDSALHRHEAHQFYGQNGFENRACLFSKGL